MKIAEIVYLYPPFPGGVADATSRLSRGLVYRGHDVTVYTCRAFDGGTAPARQLLDGVTVMRINSILPSRFVFGRTVLNPRDILNDIKKQQPDVVHLHGLGFLGNDVVAMSLKIPSVLTGHGPGWSHDSQAPWYYSPIWESYMNIVGKRVISHTRKVIALTPHEIPYWRAWGLPQEKIDIIPWGIPEDCFVPYSGSEFKKQHNLSGPVLLYVGALHPAKGPQWLIQSLPDVLRKFPSATAVLCGPDVRYKAELASLSRRLGVDRHVLFLGYVKREELMRAYSACDVFVLPTDYEAFGLVLAEAMAFGKPIVASRVGAVPFVIEDGNNGFLVNVRDYLSLAEKIMIILSDDALRRKFGERSKTLSLKYTWGAAAQRYEEIFISCVSQK